jgi:vitamin B12 transporter
VGVFYGAFMPTQAECLTGRRASATHLYSLPSPAAAKTFSFSLLSTCLALSLCTGVANAASQVAESQVADDPIEHISVTANRVSKALPETLASVTVIDRAAIEAYQPKDLADLLQLVPGVQVARDGSRGQSSSVFIRGGKSGHSLILVDGVRVGSATLGYFSIAMLPVAMIEKVEVIRGPRAALYGSDAVGGVIAITTRQIANTELNAGIGSFGQHELDLHVRQQHNDSEWFASIGSAAADGISVQDNIDPDRDGYRQYYGKLGAAVTHETGRWQWQSQLNRGYYQYDSSFGADEADTLQDSHQLQWLWQSERVQQQARASFSQDDNESYNETVAASLFGTQRRELDYQINYALLPNLSWLSGANWVEDRVEKTGAPYSQPQRHTQSIFSGLSWQWQAWLFDATGRRDNITQYGDEDSYQLAAGYQLTPELTARVSKGSSFKAPTFNELYWPKFGNPLLQPETSIAYEAGLYFANADLVMDVVHFNRDLTNMIIWKQPVTNVELATVQGAELSVQTQLWGIDPQLSYTYTDGRDSKTGLKLVKQPTHKASLVLSKQWQQWRFAVDTLYRSRASMGVDFNGKVQPDLASHVLLGTGVQYQVNPQTTLRFGIDNLLDKTYQTNLGYAQPGRELRLSVQLTNF